MKVSLEKSVPYSFILFQLHSEVPTQHSIFDTTTGLVNGQILHFSSNNFHVIMHVLSVSPPRFFKTAGKCSNSVSTLMDICLKVVEKVKGGYFLLHSRHALKSLMSCMYNFCKNTRKVWCYLWFFYYTSIKVVQNALTLRKIRTNPNIFNGESYSLR